MAINFPNSPSIGDVFVDTTSGFSYEWTGSLWKSFSSGTVSNIQILDDISGSFNNSLTTFNLTVGSDAATPANAQQLEIILGGIQQAPGVDYTVSSSTVTFTTAPTSGLTFSGKLLGTALSLNTISADTDGSGLVSLNASELDSGTVPDARFPATLPAASGANLTTLNASELDSGTVADARLGTVSSSKLSGALPAIDGSALINVTSGVGIKTAGGLVGYGATILDFRGAGLSTVTSPHSGISTINIVGGGSGTGLSTTGINTGFIFSNPNSIDSAQELTNAGHNYAMFGPISLNATVTVGAGNTFTIV